MKLSHKFFVSNVLMIIIAIGATSSLCLYKMQEQFKHKASIDMDARLRTLKDLLQSKGTPLSLTDGKLRAGNYVINDNFELPDQIKSIFGGSATIFMGDTRVSTNVANPDGSRAVGTKLKGPAYAAVIEKGTKYRGTAEILGVPYFTAYDPIKDEKGQVIGVLYVGEKQGEYLAVYDRLKYLVAGLSVALALTLSFLSLLLVQKGLQPLAVLASMIKDIAEGEGDLTKRLSIRNEDEVGEVSSWFNVFIGKLQESLAHVSQTTQQVTLVAAQMHANAGQMATGAEEVAAQAGTVATAGEEMSATSADIARNCSIAAAESKQASEAADLGVRVVEETIAVMESIAQGVGDTAQAISNLGKRSEQIGEIVSTIEDIADQTNLLALNAAIEAARAGEQGRGFAVVADEVRALAERTTRATREVGEMIKAIQLETRNAVAAMEEGVGKVAQGSAKAVDSGKALEMILAQITQVTSQIDQVAVAAEEQTATTAEISHNMHQITQVVASTSQGALESARAANRFTSIAEELRQNMSQFKLA